MSEAGADPAEVMWEGKFVRAIKLGRWEYASRVGDVRAVVILAEYEGKTILIDQPRVAVGGRCLELPAGLVGDEDQDATVEDTAVKELEEETGFTAERVEQLGEGGDLLGDHRVGHRLLDVRRDLHVARLARHEVALERVAGVALDLRDVGVAQRGQRRALGVGQNCLGYGHSSLPLSLAADPTPNGRVGRTSPRAALS